MVKGFSKLAEVEDVVDIYLASCESGVGSICNIYAASAFHIVHGNNRSTHSLTRYNDTIRRLYARRFTAEAKFIVPELDDQLVTLQSHDGVALDAIRNILWSSGKSCKRTTLFEQKTRKHHSRKGRQ